MQNHRRCDRCEFFEERNGSCHRHPAGTNSFPLVAVDSWCGEFRVIGTVEDSRTLMFGDAIPPGSKSRMESKATGKGAK